MLPGPLTSHVTEVSVAFWTAAVNATVCAAEALAVGGATVTVTVGSSVTIAEADLVGSRTLVAVKVTVCCAFTVGGAVYSPAITMPGAPPGINQVKSPLQAPTVTPVNCWD